jgi:hypothetical protein
MWCWRRMEKISWTDCVRYKEVLHRVKEERNILHTVKSKKAKWIGHVLEDLSVDGMITLKWITQK